MDLKKILKITFLFIVFLFASDLVALCPMCKMAAESNLNNGGSAGNGLNKGILYIFILPYLIVGTMGYLWWKNRNKGIDKIEPNESSIKTTYQ